MHVVVLGAGYAGVTVTRDLERRLPADVDLTLVNDTPDHVLQHELHRVIRRPTVANDITVSLTRATDRARVHVATVEAIDRDERVVDLSTGSLEYDFCVVCLGAETAYHGLETVRERATPLKRISHARAIRADFFDAIESTVGGVRVVVGGAGLSGVQVAGELGALVREAGVTDRTEVVLLEQFEEVAPGFPSRFGTAVRHALEAQGVDVRTETTVTGADGAIEFRGGGSLRYDQLIWTGGIRGPGTLGGDRPTVGPDLRLDEYTFGCGDAVQIEDAAGEHVPASAQSAIRAGRTAARNVDRLVRRERTGSDATEDDLAQFRFRSPGWAVSVGDDAVVTAGSTVLTGVPARAAKAAVGARYLTTLGERRKAVKLARTEWSHPSGERAD